MKEMDFGENLRDFVLARICTKETNEKIEKMPDDIQDFISGKEYECYKRGFIDGIRLATE